MSFGPGVKCLAYHGPLLYEAKVLKAYEPKTRKIRTKDGEKPVGNTAIPGSLQEQIAYYIHYKGWKATWDEWVGKDRVLELNQENIQLQKHLKDTILSSLKDSNGVKRENGLDGGDPKRIASKHQDTPEVEPKSHVGRRKRGHDDVEKPEDYYKKPEIQLLLAARLKARLVNDWECVTKNHQLVPLPRNPNVIQILGQFHDYFVDQHDKQLSSVENEVLQEVLSGLRIYFDSALGHILLYRFERQQYKDIIHDKAYKDLLPSEIYGAEHLLRLLSCLPGLIAQTSMDQQSIGVLKQHLEVLVQFLHVKENDLFVELYENTTPAYDALSRS